LPQTLFSSSWFVTSPLEKMSASRSALTLVAPQRSIRRSSRKPKLLVGG